MGYWFLPQCFVPGLSSLGLVGQRGPALMEEDEAALSFQQAPGKDYIPTAYLLAQQFSDQKLLLQQGKTTTGQELC